jgi:hypothetical protein
MSLINTNTTGGQTDSSISAIDAASAAAKARKDAKKAGKDAPASGTPASPGVPAAEKAKRTVLTPGQRQERLAQIEKDRADRKATTLAVREAAKAAKPAPEPAHMKKVAKAAAGLPALSEAAQAIFGEATASLPREELQALGAHLAHHARAAATTGALSAKVEEGQLVKVTGGDLRFLNKVGTARKPGRIRVLVDFSGSDKPGYFFTSDVTPVVAEDADDQVEATPPAPAADDSASAT